MDFKTQASTESISKTTEALNKHNFEVFHVATKEEALAKIQELIPAGSTVMNGASETLREIGYIEILKNKNHSWNNLHDAIIAESDTKKQEQLRHESLFSDYYVGSAHAITENGEIVVASNTGSQLPHLAYTSKNIILVVGSQKITPDLTTAFKRLEEYVIPLEDVRIKGIYGYGTTHTKTIILHQENAAMGRKVHVIIVNENLGF